MRQLVTFARLRGLLAALVLFIFVLPAHAAHPNGYPIHIHSLCSDQVYLNSSAGDLMHAANHNAGGVTWQNWGHPVGYTLWGKPTLASWGASRMDIYSTAIDGVGAKKLFHRSWDDGTDSGWQLVSTHPGCTQIPCPYNFDPGSPPSATSWGPNNVVLSIVDQSVAPHLVTGTSTDGLNFGWADRSNNGDWLEPTAAPDVGSHDSGTADVFVTDIFHNIQHFWIVNGSAGWDASPPNNSGQPVKAGTGPAVVGRGDQRFLLQYTGADNSVWQREYNFGWRSWVRILWPGGVNSTYSESDVSSW